MMFICASLLSAIIMVSFERRLNGILAAVLWFAFSAYAFL